MKNKTFTDQKFQPLWIILMNMWQYNQIGKVENPDNGVFFLSWFSNQKISGNNFIIIEIGHKNNFWYFLNFQKDFQILNFPIPVF